MNQNELIAEFMGFTKVTIDYVDTEYETQWQKDNQDWIEKMEIDSVGDYYVNVPENKFFDTEDGLKYDTSWDWLIPVVEKIEKMGGETVLFKFNHISQQSPGYTGLHLFTIDNGNELFENDGDSKKEAVYKTVVKFIEWFNYDNEENGEEIKLEKNENK